MATISASPASSDLVHSMKPEMHALFASERLQLAHPSIIAEISIPPSAEVASAWIDSGANALENHWISS